MYATLRISVSVQYLHHEAELGSTQCCWKFQFVQITSRHAIYGHLTSNHCSQRKKFGALKYKCTKICLTEMLDCAVFSIMLCITHLNSLNYVTAHLRMVVNMKLSQNVHFHDKIRMRSKNYQFLLFALFYIVLHCSKHNRKWSANYGIITA